MTGADLREARRTLGEMWGRSRPLTMAEMGRILRLRGREPGEAIRDWERGAGPTGVGVRQPAGLQQILRSNGLRDLKSHDIARAGS